MKLICVGHAEASGLAFVIAGGASLMRHEPSCIAQDDPRSGRPAVRRHRDPRQVGRKFLSRNDPQARARHRVRWSYLLVTTSGSVNDISVESIDA